MKPFITFAILLASAATGFAQGSMPPPAPQWSVGAYAQQGFPKQTIANQQIADLNAQLGTHFPVWSDQFIGNVGLLALRQVTPRLKLGVQADYSRGSLGGDETIQTPAGPATASFAQRYGVFVDVMGAAQFHFTPHRRVDAFLRAAAGMAVETVTTKLRITNTFIDQGLDAADNTQFVISSFGGGLDLSLTERCFLELSGMYTYANKTNIVPAQGSLSTGTVVANTEVTGPSYSMGIGYRFGRSR